MVPDLLHFFFALTSYWLLPLFKIYDSNFLLPLLDSGNACFHYKFLKLIFALLEIFFEEKRKIGIAVRPALTRLGTTVFLPFIPNYHRSLLLPFIQNLYHY